MHLKISGKYEMKISCSEGPTALASTVKPKPGMQSSGFRVLGQNFANGVLEIEVAGKPGHENTLELYLPHGFVKIEGASDPRKLRKNVIGINVTFPQSAEPYARKKIRITTIN
jgi:hypothetical protein